ncbi:phosphatidylserine decarboxylase proenzyme [Elsinoe ampelina]|uniref:Phosphatidylserine decarboxylase proenzyme 2 n=1 Tax=Elsinoe ampelina TaxID=302913 RepID=A0A6A6G546_9PEZI|nr:phosphatidylserine decarboxylase proenzyme [Elsinoe ampelina]
MPRPHFASHLSLKRLYSSGSNNNSKADLNGATTPGSQTNGASSPTKMKEHGEKPAILTLHVQVLKARNLAPKDKSGLSDPYLVINLGDAREASSVVPKTLNPEWNQTFNLPVSGIDSLLLEVVCWDKDRFGKDYMGEFDLIVEDIFKNGSTTQEAQWYKLEAKKSGKKKPVVSGEVLLKFSISDPTNSTASPQQILQKFYGVAAEEPREEDDDLDELARTDTVETADLDDDDESEETGQTTPSDDSHDPDKTEKRKRRHKLARLKRKTKLRAYEFNGISDTAGVLFLEVVKVSDLPPERNVTRTSFDVDPFVITSLGKKTYRTRVIRHNLNPVFEEKLVFQVLRHEINYSLHFTIMDRDKLSGNDFIGNVDLPLEKIVAAQPDADPVTGLFNCQDPPEHGITPSPEAKRSRFRLPISRSSSYTSLGRSRNSSSQNLPKLVRTDSSTSNSGPKKPSLRSEDSSQSIESMDDAAPTSSPQLRKGSNQSNGHHNGSAPAIQIQGDTADDPDFNDYSLPLKLKKAERWESKHNPTLLIRAKYLPYQALRQQFWRAMLRQYDADDSGKIDKVELTTMLDTLGSTLRDTTIDSFFTRFAKDNGGEEILTMDQAVMCLEDQLQKYQSHKSIRDTIKGSLPAGLGVNNGADTSGSVTPSAPSSSIGTPLNNQSQTSIIPAIETMHLDKEGEEGMHLPANDLADGERGEEHVVEIQECPICHQPRLDKKKNSEADIITHIATCASQDWRAVNNIVMGGFVTSSQAQRKWYSKVITKIGYGGYKIGANSANILVQDRITGQINEERMSVYVRLGIRLLYKGLGSKDMEKKRIRKLLKSMSFKQGRKYDDPASAAQIPGFINFHQLDMSEVLLPTSEFKTFNEFFYRQLKPTARPCSAPDRPEIITSPADCRSVVFNKLEDAQRIWVKGREFSVERLLGNAYPQDAKRYKGGSLGIMRLAPQDYHRFHIPVDGVMGEPKTVEGEYYTVNPMAIRSALDVYGENVRVLVPIDSEKHGRVMVICVGAMMVGSTVITRKGGEKVKRAEELGYFKFGGSTILLLFEPGAMEYDQDLVDNSSGALETLIRVGMSIGHSPNHAPHLPDMRKENPTMEERQEAKRRIEGSFAPTRAIPTEADKASVM